MSEIYEKAKQIAHQLVLDEEKRVEYAEKVKDHKAQLLEIFENNSIDTIFEFNNGLVTLNETTQYVVPDGLKEATDVKVARVSENVIKEYFKGDIKLNASGKKALKKSEDPELASLIDTQVKRSIKVVLG